MRRIAVIAIAGLLIVGSLTAPVTAGERVPIPGGVFYFQSAATVHGGEAAWINPAGLGYVKADQTLAMVNLVDNGAGLSWGLAATGQGFGVAYRTLKQDGADDFKEYVFAGGFGLGDIYTGLSYRYFKDGPGIYGHRHYWNIGLLSHFGSFAAGAVFSNLNRGKVAGVRSQTEQRYSLAYRPMGPVATLSVDMMLSTAMSFNDADYYYQLEVNPVKGLYVSGLVDSHRNFEIGVHANLYKYFVGDRSGFSRKGKHTGSDAYVGFTSQRQPSLLPEPRRRLSVNVRGGLSENPPRPVFGASSTAFVELLTGIYRAADDPGIGEMVVSLDRLAIGFAQAQELRSAIQTFRAAGKDGDLSPGLSEQYRVLRRVGGGPSAHGAGSAVEPGGVAVGADVLRRDAGQAGPERGASAHRAVQDGGGGVYAP